jgi:hypothetical protein
VDLQTSVGGLMGVQGGERKSSRGIYEHGISQIYAASSLGASASSSFLSMNVSFHTTMSSYRMEKRDQ